MDDGTGSGPSAAPRSLPSWLVPLTGPWRWVLAASALALTTLLMLPWREQLNTLNVMLLLLIACLGVGLFAGSGPAIAVSLAAFFVFDILFIPPYNNLAVDREFHLLALVSFLVVAVVTSQLVALVRRRTVEAVTQERRTTLLYELNAALVRDVSLDAILSRIVSQVVVVLGATGCRILLPESDGVLRVAAAEPASDQTLSGDDRVVAAWVVANRRAAGRGQTGRRLIKSGRERRARAVAAGAPPGKVATVAAAGERPPGASDRWFVPIATAERVIGVLEVSGLARAVVSTGEAEAILGTFADQAALALDRARLSEEAARAAALAQSDELKSALVMAVSHDLRTPLASIKAAATALLDDGVAWTPAARAELLAAVNEEADRLTLMVSNLLDLSRLEGGALQPDLAWYDLAEVIYDVERRVRPRLDGRTLTIDLAPDLPLVEIDYIGIAQVLTNLLENALKYTPPGTAIVVSARPNQIAATGDPAVMLTVRDTGPGMDRATRARLFERFHRGAPPVGTPGAGIGLTIVKGMIEAHGGTISVESAPGEGTSFQLLLPIAASAAIAAGRAAATSPADAALIAPDQDGVRG